MKRMIALCLGAASLLVLVSGAADAQPAGAGWTCTSWRETPAKAGAATVRECAQWSRGAAVQSGAIPPPPLTTPAAKPGDAKAKAGKPAEPQKRKKKQRRRG